MSDTFKMFGEDDGSEDLQQDLQTEVLTEEELERERLQREEVKKRFQKHLKEREGKPVPQLNPDLVLWEFAQSELTEDNLQEANEEYKSENHAELFTHRVSKQFRYVLEGYERQYLLSTFDPNTMKEMIFNSGMNNTDTNAAGNENNGHVDISNSKKKKKKGKLSKQTTTTTTQNLVSKSPTIPSEMKKIILKNQQNAIKALKEYENNRLKKENSLFADADDDDEDGFLSAKNLMEIQITFKYWPIYNYYINPIAIPLPKPIFMSNSVEILIFSPNKDRKQQTKKLISNEPFAPNTKIKIWEKYFSTFKTDNKRITFANTYDLVFVDPTLQENAYLLGKPFYQKRMIPVVLPKDETNWIKTINDHINGTPIFLPRGLEKLSIPVGFGQMHLESLNSNVTTILERIGQYIPNGGYHNILRIDISTESSPLLPIYANREGYNSLFKRCKQFSKGKTTK